MKSRDAPVERERGNSREFREEEFARPPFYASLKEAVIALLGRLFFPADSLIARNGILRSIATAGIYLSQLLQRYRK